ncbi:hypothetical protein [Psychroserpens sp. Hel_I_66]|uniref:hypothetical protein n=1 Tax=Psychroserpens sp. Hel_I_66 TaxID=1250004 RepID=UPI0012E0317B|nr:hypothetical protein [Psychroserpens sp. Hel_I_66]
MNSYQLRKDQLTIYIKPSPLFVRAMMFLFSFMLFTLPLFGMISYISEGQGIKGGFFFAIFIFGLFGFYLLRVALWNTYGKEIIHFDGKICNYVADYGWFRDKVKMETFSTINFAKNPVGYLEDNNYTLVIEDFNTDQEIMCVAKMKEEELEQLIKDLKLLFPEQ